eukprot:CAMPEP_0184719948 /NCGR_PEP_ID=MMETSP0314-20130426/9752_1 /TAXON_ID=38298 /ORGANISM="Rhodella maculata, Strain CCMP 736" /LENGTH=47 /DNA_ID= /DNA_START= /DNA_END= /DNA_ORIENTATION=
MRECEMQRSLVKSRALKEVRRSRRESVRRSNYHHLQDIEDEIHKAIA